MKLFAILSLLLRFSRALLQSGLQTAALIVRYGAGQRRLDPGLIEIRFSPMHPAGVSLLAAMITLTPGTTVVGIDLDALTLRLHLLDRRDAEAAVAAIRREFEPGLLVLFGSAA